MYKRLQVYIQAVQTYHMKILLDEMLDDTMTNSNSVDMMCIV